MAMRRTIIHNAERVPHVAILCASAGILLSSCATPRGIKVLDRPIVPSASAADFFAPDRLTGATREFLVKENLLAAYRADPAGAIASLHPGTGRGPSPKHRLALAELCSDTGGNLASGNAGKAAGYHLAAAGLAYRGLGRGGADAVALRRAYNFSTGQAAKLLFDSGFRGGGSASVSGPWHSYRVSWRRTGAAVADPAFFDRIEPADFLEPTRLHESPRKRVDGVGAALVGHRDHTGEREKENPFMSPAGMSLPLAGTATFTGSGRGVELTLRDLLVNDQARVAGRAVTLSGDYTAALMSLFRYDNIKMEGLGGMFHPGKYDDVSGLYALEPFRRDKIPLVFVHGLGSNPATWTESINMVWGDPVLRKKYQVMVFFYPTGFPITYCAAMLRKWLRRYREHHDPGRGIPSMRRMVLTGHSMGGLLSSFQVRSTGDALLNIYFAKPLDEIRAFDAREKKRLRESLVFEANPDVRRVVFVAAPHRGSRVASNPLGEIGIAMIKLPRRLLSDVPRGVVLGMTPYGRKALHHYPNSIRQLEPHTLLLETVVSLPIRSGATYHSIIGRAHPSDPLPESGDTVVPYWSSHLDGAASEKIVHSIHTKINRDPITITEVRRILYLHLGLKADG